MAKGFRVAVVLIGLLYSLGGTLTADDSEANVSGPPPVDKTTENAAERLDDIFVSATGYEKNVIDAPASVYVITREDLENKSFNDLTDVLKNVPGVNIEGGAVFKDISIRGMSSGYTLYLIDGKPMSGNDAHSPNGMAGGVAVNSLPPVSMIERIEVIRGPMSSLYGSEAMGGVINIITKKVPVEWSGSVKTEYTKTLSDVTQNGYAGSLNLAGPVVPDLLSLQTYGSVLQVDEQHCPDLTPGHDCGDKSSAPAPSFDSRQVGAKAILSIDKANSVWAAYDYARQEKKETEGVSYAEVNASGSGGSNRVNGVAIKQTASAGHDLNLDNFTLNTYLQNAVTKNPTRVNGIDYEVLTFNTQGNYFFETNVLSVGAQYKKEMLDDRATNVMHADNNGTAITGYKSYEVTKYQYSIFAEDEWGILENLSLTGGLRFSNYEDYGSHFTPRVYAVYGVTDNIIVKGGVSGGYKVPSLRQSADDFGGVSGGGSFPPVVNIGSPDVDPESSVNYEASVAYNNRDIGFGASVTIYRSEYKDKIESYQVCDGGGSRLNARQTAANNGIPYCTKSSKDYYEALDSATYADSYMDLNGGPYSSGSRYRNVKGAELQGVEVTLNYDLPSIVSLVATYTQTDSEQKTGANKGKALNATPEHMFNANVDFDVTEKFSLWAQYNYRGKSLDTTVSTSASDIKNKAYDFIDIGTVVRLKDNMKFIAGVYNVADEEVTYETRGKVLEGRRLIAGINADF